MFGRNKIAMLVAEFLGTGVLTLVVLSVQRSTIGVPYFVAAAAGLTIALLMVVFGAASGAHFNPAITIGLWTTRQVKSLQAVVYIVAQLLGAWAAYYLYTYFVKSSLQEIGGHYDGRILVAEAVGAFIFALGWGAIAFNRFLNAKAAATVGAALMLGMVVAASAAIGLVNPALALGVRAWDIWGAMGWGTYVLGPVLGAVIGLNLYALLFAPERSLLSFRTRSTRATTATVAAKPAARRTATKPAARKKTTRTTRTRK